MLIGMRNAMLAGGGLSAKSYVQDGLVAMWDGEWNAGGVHDPNATKWVDLVGGVELSKYGTPTINTDSYSFDGSSAMYKSQSFGEIDHWEIVCALMVSSVTANSDPEIMRLNGTWQQKCYTWNGMCPGIGFGIPMEGGASPVSNEQGAVGKRWSLAWSSAITPQKVYRNGVQAATWNATFVQETTSSIIIGAGGTLYRPSKSEVCCVRLYSRALTAAEVAANYAIDKARFNLT